jgi:hypothetical protein
MTTRSDNPYPTAKSRIQSKIRFLEDQLASLDHYLPETYEYLMQELDLQRRLLVELEIKDAFTLIDAHQDHQIKITGSPNL